MRVLVTGVTGYVGGALVPHLLAEGHEVSGLSRNPARSRSDISTYKADIASGQGLKRALSGVDVAYYLAHAYESSNREGFAARDRRMAQQFASAAHTAGVRRVVHLGVLDAGSPAERSAHQASRAEVEQILRGTTPESTTLRAGVVIGESNWLFRTLAAFARRSPVVVLPHRGRLRVQPIDERDLIACLVAAATSPAVAGKAVDIAGEDVVTQRRLMELLLRSLGRTPRVFGVPLFARNSLAGAFARLGEGDPVLLRELFHTGLTDSLARDNAAPSLGIQTHSLVDALRHATAVGSEDRRPNESIRGQSPRRRACAPEPEVSGSRRGVVLSAGAGDAAARERLRASVMALASRDRRTATDGERSSAEWIERRLVEMGAQRVEQSRFRTQSSWRPIQLGYVIAGMLANSQGGAMGRLAALAVAVSYELDTSGRTQWARRILPAGTGTTVEGRIMSARSSHRTLILVAHHDAAHGGLVWHPRVTAANRWYSRRTGRTIPSHVPLLAGILAAAIPSAAGSRIAYSLLSATGLLIVESVSSSTTPGANDNASGVAAVLELARQFTQQPLDHTDILVLFPGGEEVGNTGMRAWTKRRGRWFDPETTLLVNLDAIGSGEHLVVPTREGLTGWYAALDVRLVVEAAAAEGIALRPVTFANVTDGFAGG